MEFDKYDDGVPSWVDLSSPDLAATRSFYSSLLGWDCPEGPPEAGGYSVCTLAGKTVAGLGPQMNPDFPPMWMTYVNVEDADFTVAKVKKHGGAVFVEPMQVMTAGRMAIFADPAGAVIGLWQPGDHPGAQIANEPGTYCWSELITTDVPGAKSFYRGVFGWDAEDLGDGSYTEWKRNGKSLGGMMPKHDDMPADMPPNWGVYFAVEDCDAAVSTAQSGGATVLVPQTDIEPGRFAVLLDNVGAAFNVIALKSGM